MGETDEALSASRDRHERESKAQDLAIQAALEKQRIDLKLQDHEDAIKELRAGQATMTVVLNDVKAIVAKLVTLGEAASRDASNSLSAKQFYVGLGALAAAVVGVLLSVHGG